MPAKPAPELKIGDRTQWNFGYVYGVEAISTMPSGKMLEAQLHSEKDDTIWRRRFKPSRLVGLAID